MKYDISTESWHTTISVAVPAENARQELEDNFQDYQKTASVGGFRKGKVPPSLIKKMFGKQIEKKVFAPYLQQAWNTIFKEKKFDLLTEPKISDINLTDNNELEFNIEFDSRPDIEIHDYKNLPVEKVKLQVTEEVVQKNLESVRQRQAMVYNVEGEAEEGHYIITDLQEIDRTGVPVVGQKATDRPLYLSKENPEILEQLKGVKVGDTRRVFLKIEKQKSELDTGPVKTENKLFNVHVKEIKERRVPDLDDELAKDLGFESLDEFTKTLKNDLQRHADAETKSNFELALEDELIKRNDFEAPAFYVNNYLNAVVQDSKKDGVNKNVDEEQLKEYYRPIAIRNVKWIVIREKLIEQFGLEVTEKEIDDYIAEIQEQGAGLEQVQKLKNNRQDLKNSLLSRKVHDFLAENAEITEVKQAYLAEQEHQKINQ